MIPCGLFIASLGSQTLVGIEVRPDIAAHIVNSRLGFSPVLASWLGSPGAFGVGHLSGPLRGNFRSASKLSELENRPLGAHIDAI